MKEEIPKNYLETYLVDTDCKDLETPIVFNWGNVERCEIINFVKGWDSRGCLDKDHAKEIARKYGIDSKPTYTRVFYRCPKHGYVNDNLYFGSEEENTGVCKCYLCIEQEIVETDDARLQRKFAREKKAKEEAEKKKQNKGR